MVDNVVFLLNSNANAILLSDFQWLGQQFLVKVSNYKRIVKIGMCLNSLLNIVLMVEIEKFTLFKND